jgi:hypothetical protein
MLRKNLNKIECLGIKLKKKKTNPNASLCSQNKKSTMTKQ